MSCTGIAANIAFNCNSTGNNAGVEELAVLFRWSDIDQGACTFDATNPLKLETLVGDSSPLAGYSYTSAFNAIRPNFSKVADGFNPNKYAHVVNLPIYGEDPTTNRELEKLVGDKVVAVVFTNARTVEVFGFWSGLYVTSYTKDFYENEASHQIVLSTPEGVAEPSIPYHYVGSSSPSDDFETLRAEILAYVS